LYNLKDVGRKSCFGEDVGDTVSDEWRLRGWLENYRVSSKESRNESIDYDEIWELSSDGQWMFGVFPALSYG
jgi:hypothetical protein